MTATLLFPDGFTHLHVHSHFTLLGATPSPAELAQQARADGLTSLALTDSNALYGAVAFDRACRAAGVRPILGMAVAVAPLSALDLQDGLGAGQLVLLATGPDGYRSLCRLSSAIQSHPDRAERAAHGVDWETLKAHRKGLICLSGGRRGWIERCLRAGNRAAATRYAGRLAGLFDQHTFLALEIHRDEDRAVAAEIAALGRRLGIPAAAV
ncbi:MAG: PHP domain-containing protein, partial [Anaerolineae bacterium]|nr:PHP domain-containing protein [Anaerolineae bacterium]